MLYDLIIPLISLALVLTIPGYFLSLAFFPKKNEIDEIERFTFSMVFSIAFLPLLILIENLLLSIPIDFTSVFGTLLFLIIIGLIVYWVRIRKMKKDEVVDIIFFRPFIKK
ncbi:MAG: DUF1616 domain-containing protein [Candidatus Diapherotrites archaeon]